MNVNVKVAGTAAALATLNELSDRASGGDRWRVEATADYAGFVENGTRHMAAQPYMAPAQQTVEANALSHVARASNMNDALRSIAFAIEGEAKRIVPVDTGNLRSTIRARKL